MRSGVSRRGFVQAAGALALAPPLAAANASTRDWPPAEGEGVPKLCLGIGANADPKQMRMPKDRCVCSSGLVSSL